MLGDLFQDGDYARQPDDLRPRADDVMTLILNS